VAVFATRDSRAVATYDDLMQSARGQIADQELATWIEREVLPVWEKGQARSVTRTNALREKDENKALKCSEKFAQATTELKAARPGNDAQEANE